MIEQIWLHHKAHPLRQLRLRQALDLGRLNTRRPHRLPIPLGTNLIERINNKIKVIKRMVHGFRDDA